MEKLKKIKILVLDLDNTVVNAVLETIKDEVVKSVIKIQKKGIKIVLNTGRCIKDSLWVSKKFKLEKFGGFIIALNGSIIYNSKTKKTIVTKVFNIKQKKILISESNNLSLSTIFMSNNLNQKNFLYKRTFLLFFFSIFRKSFRFKKFSKTNILNKEFSSGIVIGSNKLIEKFVNNVTNKSEEIIFVSGMKNTMQFSLTNKLTGIKKILYELKIKDDEVMVMGDSLNDLPLFLKFKYSIAMGNAVFELKNKAYYITSSYLFSGVAKAIKKFLL